MDEHNRLRYSFTKNETHFTSTMTLTNATATDTGYFTCVRRERNIDYFETILQRKKYVYFFGSYRVLFTLLMKTTIKTSTLLLQMASKTLSMLDPNRRKFIFLIRQNIMLEFEEPRREAAREGYPQFGSPHRRTFIIVDLRKKSYQYLREGRTKLKHWGIVSDFSSAESGGILKKRMHLPANNRPKNNIRGFSF